MMNVINKPIMLHVIMLSVVLLNVMAPASGLKYSLEAKMTLSYKNQNIFDTGIGSLP
jgi:hypothetical protein